VVRDLAVAVDRPALQPGLLDQAEQSLVLPMPLTVRPPPPGIEPAALDAQHPAHAGNAKFRQVRLHERVLRPYPLAKYAAAFFRMSRSSVTRRSSACSRRTSEACPASASRTSGALRRARTQAYSASGLTPNRSATSLVGRPCSSTCLAASALNSSVY